jgi:hypothetical protein
MTNKPKTSILQKLATFVAAMLILLIVYAVAVEHDREKNDRSTREPSVQDASPVTALVVSPPIAITAAKLWAVYHRNEVSGDEEFKGRVIEVTGRIGSIEKDIFGNPYVTLLNAQQYPGVVCRFSKNNSENLGDLRRGQTGTYTGTCSGVALGDVQIHVGS